MGVVSLPSWVEQLKAGDKLTGTIDAYSRFPPLYRAVNIRSDTLSSMPFKVERDGELSDWYFRTSLQSLLRDTERIAVDGCCLLAQAHERSCPCGLPSAQSTHHHR